MKQNKLASTQRNVINERQTTKPIKTHFLLLLDQSNCIKRAPEAEMAGQRRARIATAPWRRWVRTPRLPLVLPAAPRARGRGGSTAAWQGRGDGRGRHGKRNGVSHSGMAALVRGRVLLGGRHRGVGTTRLRGGRGGVSSLVSHSLRPPTCGNIIFASPGTSFQVKNTVSQEWMGNVCCCPPIQLDGDSNNGGRSRGA